MTIKIEVPSKREPHFFCCRFQFVSSSAAVVCCVTGVTSSGSGSLNRYGFPFLPSMMNIIAKIMNIQKANEPKNAFLASCFFKPAPSQSFLINSAYFEKHGNGAECDNRASDCDKREYFIVKRLIAKSKNPKQRHKQMRCGVYRVCQNY